MAHWVALLMVTITLTDQVDAQSSSSGSTLSLDTKGEENIGFQRGDIEHGQATNKVR